MKRVGLCFPGQGSQYPGMADGLLTHPLAEELLQQAQQTGLDLRGLLVTGSADDLRDTSVAQPALFLVEIVLAVALMEHAEVIAVAGHSVGEYAAVVAAGSLTAADGMQCVIARGQAMGAMHNGTMAAVMGVEASTVADVCAQISQHDGEVVVPANFNSPGQVVISGTEQGITAAGDALRELGARRIVALNVGGAFHSPLMQPAAEQFGSFLDTVEFRDAHVPFVSNVDAGVVQRAADVREHLRQQLSAPVQWEQCVRELIALGCEFLVEVGPGNVLTGLAQRIVPDTPAVSLMSLNDIPAVVAHIKDGARV